MSERNSFSDAYRELAVPKLERLTEALGLFVALGLDRFHEAHNELMREALRLGAGYLPEEHYDELIDWSLSILLQMAVSAEERHAQ